jgi:propionyl-CoA carboxylase beta chain
MGAEGAVNIIFNKEINAAADPKNVSEERINQYNEEYLNPYLAAREGYVDEIIEPEQTRRRVFESLKRLSHKQSIEVIQKRHGNIPL